MDVVRLICFITSCPRVETLTALHTAGGVFLSCVHGYCVFRAVQASLQTTTNRCTGGQYSVATSWLVVGARGTQML